MSPDPWYVLHGITADEFILRMLELGSPTETSIVGVFDKEGRGSRRDIDLPLHRDGEFSAALADVQGGFYVEKPGIDIVGLYCLRDGTERCVTIVDDAEVELKQGDALIFDNRRVLHGRKGPVGERLLIRMWVKRADNSSAQGEPNGLEDPARQ